MFIVFEGIDGAGKTVLSRMLSFWLAKEYQGVREVVLTREPSGCQFADEVKCLLRKYDGLTAQARMFLYLAANRFAWRKARPQVHEPGTWYNSCENTASVKRLTAS